MTRAEIERRLKMPLLAVHVAGMAPTAVARERELEMVTEQVLNAVEAIVREEVAMVVRKIGKSVQRAL